MKRFAIFLLLVFPIGRLAAQYTPTVVRLNVKANPAPVPALTFVLLPPAREIQPGNAATLYFRSFAPEWWGPLERHTPEFWTKVSDARSLPLAKMKDLAFALPVNMLSEVDRAARREYCDWEMGQRVAENGVLTLLPDLQSMRSIALFLMIRARQEIAAGEIDKAIRTLQTALQLAKHVGEGSTLMNTLVGVAIGNMTCQQIEEFMQQPQAPNLYWALSQLPSPFIDLRRPLNGERQMMDSEFADVRSLDKGPVSEEQALKVLEAIVRRGPYWDMRIDKPTLMKESFGLYPKAKQALEAQGVPAAEIEKMPCIQVVLLHSWHEMERLHDERVKWMQLPFADGREGMLRAIDMARDLAERNEIFSFMSDFGLGLIKVRQAVLLIDRKIAILRCVEAIKLHAAETGKFPASLGDIKTVPVPNDPLNNKPFEYRLDGATAMLTALNYKNAGFSSWQSGWRYEISLQH